MNKFEKRETLQRLRKMHEKFGREIAVERKNGSLLRFGDIIDDIIETVNCIPAAEDCHTCKDCKWLDREKRLDGGRLCTKLDVFIFDETEGPCIYGERRTAEPQLDGIQFRTVDDLGRICIPRDIRNKLGIKPGTECAVYATDELTTDEIIVIRRNKNEQSRCGKMAQQPKK